MNTPEVSHIAEIRRHLPIGLSADAKTIEAAPVTAGSRSLYLLVRTTDGSAETPTFLSGKQNSEEAVPIFSTRESAVHFRQVTRWEDYKVDLISPRDLVDVMQRLAQEGVRYVMMDPNRQDQERGVTQPLLDLEKIRDFSGENLFEEIGAADKSQP